jgi:PAS domain S-box-containing protein
VPDDDRKRAELIGELESLRARLAKAELALSEHRRVQAELRESERFLATLAANLPGMVYRCHNDPDWTMEFVSEGSLELTGYPPPALVGNTEIAYAELIHPDDRERLWNDVQTALLQKRPFRLTYRILRATGEERWVWEQGRGIFSTEGKLLALEGFITDITSVRRAEEERLELERQVQHGQKLESLGVLAGGIAHDFNNLLTAVLGHVELALRSLAPASPARGAVEKIELAASRATELARQMLAYSGKGRFTVEPVDLGEVIREMNELLAASIGKGAVLRYELAEDLPAIEADVTQIRQIVMNLIMNASEAIGDRDGVISVMTGKRELHEIDLSDALVDHRLSVGSYACLEVSDTGSGMDPETRERIFDPFFTTKFTGRGLGLAAVLGIIRGHGGAITVRGEPGKGSTFTVYLPACHRPAKPRESRPSETDEWRGSGTILLVDDEETVRTVGRAMLEELGFSVETAPDGREAVDLYRRRAEEIRGVVLDLTMPHMSGEETLRELRRIRKDVVVVMASGYSEEHIAPRIADGGLAGFVQKPYRLAHLAGTLRRALSDS